MVSMNKTTLDTLLRKTGFTTSLASLETICKARIQTYFVSKGGFKTQTHIQIRDLTKTLPYLTLT